MQDYPAQIDCVWLSADIRGSLAAMITAGCGPIPASALAGEFDVLDTEEMIRDLPIICDAEILVTVPDPSSFMALASRGLFVYDWSDIHRTSRQAIHAYELMAVPLSPLSDSRLPPTLRKAVTRLDSTILFGVAKIRIK